MDKIVLIGEPMAMFFADYVGNLEDIDKFTKALAGAEVNVCIGLKRLGYDVSYITKLGEDPFGIYIKRFLDKEGINTSYISFDSNYPTAFQIKGKTIEGDPEVVYFRKGSAAAHISKKDIEKIDLEEVSHVHITGIPLALSESFREATYELIKNVKEKGIFITFDPNLRPSLWKSKEEMIRIINDVASRCDMILPGINEGLILTGSSDLKDIGNFYLDLGVKTVIVKLGEEGAFVKTKHENFCVPGFKVDKVIDTVGAGDGFAVGMISGLLKKMNLKDSVIRGNAIGAMQVMVPGDNDGLPTEQKLQDYLSEKMELKKDQQ